MLNIFLFDLFSIEIHYNFKNQIVKCGVNEKIGNKSKLTRMKIILISLEPVLIFFVWKFNCKLGFLHFSLQRNLADDSTSKFNSKIFAPTLHSLLLIPSTAGNCKLHAQEIIVIIFMHILSFARIWGTFYLRMHCKLPFFLRLFPALESLGVVRVARNRNSFFVWVAQVMEP